MSDKERIIETIATGDASQREQLKVEILENFDENRTALCDALDDPAVRRWVRSSLLERLGDHHARDIAAELLAWTEDFEAGKRDRTTANVVSVLTPEQLEHQLLMLAGSNTASALWDRIAAQGSDAVANAVARVFSEADTIARETTLHMLVLDPYGPDYLPLEQQDAVLVSVLDDPDPEIRGLAAEVIAADLPETLLDRWEFAPLDDSERVRMAFWRAALVHRPNAAIDFASELALDPRRPHPARRTALLSLGENAGTSSVAPVLQAILRGDDQVLAEDGAQLMWRHHRTPDVANAAAESQFEPVRELAQRLLHPEMGSPAAGGSRPGDPTRTTDIFEQIQSVQEQDRSANSDEPPLSRDRERGRG